MPNLACRICGRVVYTASPITALFAEERRCPRCGGLIDMERRVGQRRKGDRRVNPTNDPGGPDGVERRVAQRRLRRRRRSDDPSFLDV